MANGSNEFAPHLVVSPLQNLERDVQRNLPLGCRLLRFQINSSGIIMVIPLLIDHLAWQHPGNLSWNKAFTSG